MKKHTNYKLHAKIATIVTIVTSHASRLSRVTLFCFSALLLFSLLLSCKKEIDEKSKPEIPDETSTYWENDYLRYLLKGNVKTVTEYSEYGKDNGSFKKLSFDQNGNLKEDAIRKDAHCISQTRNRNS